MVKGISQVALQTKLMVVCFMSLAVAILLIISLNTQPTQAQDSSQNFGELFSLVHDRMQDEGLLVTISLHTPIGDATENITVGYGYEDIQVSIYEIGSDYFCTREVQGGAELINCTLFSNIAGMTYINN